MSSPPGITTEVAALPDHLSLVDDPMYRVGEVATVLKKSPAFVWQLLSSGALVSVKVGAARRVRKSDLDKYIAGLVPSIPARPRGAASASS